MPGLPVYGNLLSLADSDVEGGVGDWVLQTSGTLASSTTQAYSGTHSLSMTSSASGLIDSGITTVTYTVTPLLTYTFSAYIYPVTTAFLGAQDIDWYNGSTFLSNTQNNGQTTTAGRWNLLSISGAAPSTATHAQLFLGYTATASGNVSYFDLMFFGIPKILQTARPRAGMPQAVTRAAFW